MFRSINTQCQRCALLAGVIFECAIYVDLDRFGDVSVVWYSNSPQVFLEGVAAPGGEGF